MTDEFKQALLSYRATRNAKEGLVPERLSATEADARMHILLSHAMEELVELLMCVNRKSWKPMPSLRGDTPDSLLLRQQALEELADVLLMLDAFRDMAQFSLGEVISAVEHKMAKNLNRADHVCNVGHLQ